MFSNINYVTFNTYFLKSSRDMYLLLPLCLLALFKSTHLSARYISILIDNILLIGYSSRAHYR